MMELVSWDDDIPNMPISGKVIKFHGSSHRHPVDQRHQLFPGFSQARPPRHASSHDDAEKHLEEDPKGLTGGKGQRQNRQEGRTSPGKLEDGSRLFSGSFYKLSVSMSYRIQ